MLGLEADVQREFDRVVAGYSESVSFLPPALSVMDVLRAHFLIANHFYLEGEGIGGIGPRDINMLESTVFRQVSSFAGQAKWTGLFEVTSTLFYGIVKNHCFYDANKRTAFLSLLYQLYEAGFCPRVSEKEMEDFTVEVAENALNRYARYKELVKNGDPDPEVRFISYWLKSRMRRIDRQKYTVTYRELQTILNRYGVHLENPNGNFIDVVEYRKKKRRFLGIPLSEETVAVRLGNIIFPRWTAQVPENVVKRVRELAGLRHKDGVDSGAFFKGLDPMQTLITSYNEPLMRLASR